MKETGGGVGPVCWSPPYAIVLTYQSYLEFCVLWPFWLQDEESSWPQVAKPTLLNPEFLDFGGEKAMRISHEG